MTSIQSVTVFTAGQEYTYPWATGVRVDRKGDLRIMQGWRQRAYHPRGEWLSYTAANRHAPRSSP